VEFNWGDPYTLPFTSKSLPTVALFPSQRNKLVSPASESRRINSSMLPSAKTSLVVSMASRLVAPSLGMSIAPPRRPACRCNATLRELARLVSKSGRMRRDAVRRRTKRLIGSGKSNRQAVGELRAKVRRETALLLSKSFFELKQFHK
jgi:hypothetical protein